MVAFLAYCLSVTLQHKLRGHGPGLTPRAVLEKLAVQMLDVSFPTTDGRMLVMPRYTEPEPEQALMLHQLGLALPQQPLPASWPPLPKHSPNSKCSGDLWDAPVESKGSPGLKCPELRRFG